VFLAAAIANIIVGAAAILVVKPMRMAAIRNASLTMAVPSVAK
jgi:hypothetical protein